MGGFKNLRVYFPVFLTLVISLPLVYIVYASSFFIQATLFIEEGSGAKAASAGIMNALVFLIGALIGGTFIYILFKKRKEKVLYIFFMVCFVFVLTVISMYFISSGMQILYHKWSVYYRTVSLFPNGLRALDIIYMVSWPILDAISLGFAVMFSIYITSCIFKTKWIYESNTALIIMASMTGAFLAVLLPLYSAVFLLIFLSIYDIYAVFKGPIRKIAELSDSIEHPPIDDHEGEGMDEGMPSDMQEDANGMVWTYIEDEEETFDETLDDNSFVNRLTYKTPYWDLGLGDLVFYSVLTSLAFIHGARNFGSWGLFAPWIPFIVVALAVMAGLYITIKLLERNYLLPGLPISITLGLGTLTLVHGIYTLL